jgi:hypothetical protein
MGLRVNLMVLTLGDLKFLKELKAAGDLGRNVRELTIRVTLDRLVKGGYLVGRPTDRHSVQYRITQRGRDAIVEHDFWPCPRKDSNCVVPTLKAVNFWPDSVYNAPQIFCLNQGKEIVTSPKNGKFKDYARYAEHCLNMVAATTDRESRSIQREMAAEWLRLADEMRRPRKRKQMQMGWCTSLSDGGFRLTPLSVRPEIGAS